MAKKPKTGGARAKAKAARTDQQEQSRRFKETARELGADRTGKTFEAAFDSVVKRRQKN